MKTLKFHKMQGTGNDFVVLDNRNLKLSENEIIRLTPQLCDRKYGIGADGLLELEISQKKGVDFTMIYRNADGSDAGMCGNGARCLAMFAAHHGFKDRVSFNVHNAVYKATINKAEELVIVHFPDIEPPNWIEIDNHKLIQVYPNTEHVVCLTAKHALEEEQDLIDLGTTIRNADALKPQGTNVNFVHIQQDNSILLQTYERGVENLTLACGTGAIASAIAVHFVSGSEAVESSIAVLVKGGELEVNFTFDSELNSYKNVTLKGPAEFVYEGTIHI
jgi:diaminopimelate epimerase